MPTQVTLVLAGIGVEDDDTMIGIAVGDIKLVGAGIDEGFGRQAGRLAGSLLPLL
jgi:hypothetical protein